MFIYFDTRNTFTSEQQVYFPVVKTHLRAALPYFFSGVNTHKNPKFVPLFLFLYVNLSRAIFLTVF